MEKLFTYNLSGRICALIAAAVLAAAFFIGCGNQSAGIDPLSLDAARNSQSPDALQESKIADALQDSRSADATQNFQSTDTAQNKQGAAVSQNTLTAEDNVTSLSGSLRLAGSTSMEKYANALAESFMEKYPNVSVTVEFVGSGAGIEAVIAGSADIGNSSRNLKDEEKINGAVENIVAMDGIAVCVHPEIAVTNLTKQQLIDIYIGVVNNWSELGGLSLPIVVVGRESGSGTRNAFEEILGVEDVCDYANELDSSGAVLAKVASTPGAIGYVSLDVVEDSVTALSLDGAEPTVDNIRGGSYFLSRLFVMATKGAISEQGELVQAWFGYIYSEEGQEIAVQTGLVTVQ